MKDSINVENSMANSTDNRKPLVKLAIAILDDPHGISVEAFDALWECSAVSETRSELESIFSKVKKGEGRVYLPEDWDSFSVTVPFIGKMKEDGQVEFKPGV